MIGDVFPNPILMMAKSNFFSAGDCVDPDYSMVRDSPKASRCREHVEGLWQIYEPYSDVNFLSNARSQFHQRYWEMYLCVSLLERGFGINKIGSEGPEFYINICGRKFWFEAIAPLAGTGRDRVPELEMNKANSTPVNQVLLRYTSAVAEKHKKYKDNLAKGIIAPGDGYVIAINGAKVPNALFGSFLPYHVQALLPIGSPTIVVDSRTRQKVGEHYQYRENVLKQSGNPVSTAAFLDPAYSGISAVVSAVLDVAGYTYGSTRCGSDFDVLHNPMASTPLALDALHWCKNRYLSELPPKFRLPRDGV